MDCGIDHITIGHNSGAAVWIQAVNVDMKEKITSKDVHEIGMEISVDEELFNKLFLPIFLKYFDADLPENKNRFTRAFIDNGRFLTGFEKDILEHNFFTVSAMKKIIAELLEMDSDIEKGIWAFILKSYLEKLLSEVAEGQLISVMS